MCVCMAAVDTRDAMRADERRTERRQRHVNYFYQLDRLTKILKTKFSFSLTEMCS